MTAPRVFAVLCALFAIGAAIDCGIECSSEIDACSGDCRNALDCYRALDPDKCKEDSRSCETACDTEIAAISSDVTAQFNYAQAMFCIAGCQASNSGAAFADDWAYDNFDDEDDMGA